MNNLNNQLENVAVHKSWGVSSLKADSCWSNDLFCQHVGDIKWKLQLKADKPMFSSILSRKKITQIVDSTKVIICGGLMAC